MLLDCEGGYPEWLGTGDFAQMADLRDFGDEVKEWQGTLCGTNMIVRAEVFRKSGSYAPELGPSPSGVGMWEDTEISLRMRQAGCRMIWAPQIVVRHQWEKGRLNKAFIRSRFFGQGRAQAYYDDLPVSFLRSGSTLLERQWLVSWKHSGIVAPDSRCGHWSASAKCAVYAGLLWQHWLFKRGLPRRLSTDLLAYPPSETQAEDCPRLFDTR